MVCIFRTSQRWTHTPSESNYYFSIPLRSQRPASEQKPNCGVYGGCLHTLYGHMNRRSPLSRKINRIINNRLIAPVNIYLFLSTAKFSSLDFVCFPFDGPVVVLCAPFIDFKATNKVIPSQMNVHEPMSLTLSLRFSLNSRRRRSSDRTGYVWIPLWYSEWKMQSVANQQTFHVSAANRWPNCHWVETTK